MRRFMKFVCALIIVMVSFSVDASAQKKARDSKTTYAQEVLQPYVDNGQLSGAISVFYKDGVQETCCVGYADVAAKRPIKLDNVFMQCSQTKGFCGVTIAKLVEEGKISLDDPVSKYLPEFKELWVQVSNKDGVKTLHKAKNTLTVRMVLNHTGGFPFEASVKRNDVRGGGWSGGAPLRQVAAVAAESPIMFEPGTRELYSNTGIDIGAAIVEVVTGMKWEDYLKQEVLDPLGMKSTWFWPTDKQLKKKIELYAFKQ
ncbi:MAG: beta-lactamase family protein, partial [Alistipes sp.]|nr:beta-lactamase family protein [Alistipes sp.]